MAKKRSNRLSEVRGYTLTKIMSMSRKDLAKATSTLAQASNKRLDRLKKKGITTPASEYIKKHGGRFSTKGKDIIELREEFQRTKGFLESETSTLKGYRAWENKIATTLKNNTGIDYNSLNELQKRKFWKAYAKLEELDEANVYNQRYKSSVNEIYTAVKNGLKMKDIEKFANELNAHIYAEDNTGFLEGENDPFNLIDIDNDNPFLS